MDICDIVIINQQLVNLNFEVSSHDNALFNQFNLIDLFRGACAIKGNVQVAGHVKRVDHGDAVDE